MKQGLNTKSNIFKGFAICFGIEERFALLIFIFIHFQHDRSPYLVALTYVLKDSWWKRIIENYYQNSLSVLQLKCKEFNVESRDILNKLHTISKTPKSLMLQSEKGFPRPVRERQFPLRAFCYGLQRKHLLRHRLDQWLRFSLLHIDQACSWHHHHH